MHSCSVLITPAVISLRGMLSMHYYTAGVGNHIRMCLIYHLYSVTTSAPHRNAILYVALQGRTQEKISEGGLKKI